MVKPISPLPPAAQPGLPAPSGACDAHVHLLAGPDEYPLWPNRTEDPAQSFDAYMRQYRAHLDAMGITRGVIVQSIFYGTDNSVTIRAIREMGEGFCGIGLLTDDADDNILDRFVADRLRGVRLNYVHGGVLSWDGARAMAPRLADRGLHIQMLLHADQHMPEIAGDLPDLPVPLVIDHMGWPSDLNAGPESPGFQMLCEAMAAGDVYVKLSGLYRLTDAPYDMTDRFISALVAANPARCLWGSDWPHIMLNGAQMPPPGALWAAFHRAVPDPAVREQILVQNPARLYGF